jgi:Tfp pilus assembly protein PilF
VVRARTEEVEVVRVAAPAGGAPIVPRRRRRRVWMMIAAVPLLWAGAALIVYFTGGMPRTQAATRRREAVLLTNRGVEAFHAGAFDQARGFLSDAIAKDGRFAQAYLSLGTVALGQGRTTEAESLYMLVLDRHMGNRVDSSRAYFQLGDIDLLEGTWPSAVQNLEKSFALDSSSAGAYGNLGYALIMNQRPADARPVLDRGIARYPGAARLFKNAGLAALRLGAADAALSYERRALALEPQLAAARGLEARALDQLGRGAEARAAWKAYRDSPPDSAARAEVESGMGRGGPPR